MIRPDGLDQQQGKFENKPKVTITAGGHKCEIINADELTSKNGKVYIKLQFDFAEGDSQAGALKENFKQVGKWQSNGYAMVWVHDYNNPKESSRDFKSLVTSLQNSNGFTIDWGVDADFCKQIVGKKIGIVFQDKEQEYNGRKFWRAEKYYFCDFEEAPKRPTPQAKPLNNNSSNMNNMQSVPVENIPTGNIPF